MKKFIKILILSLLSFQGLAQSTMNMGANEIKINRPLVIEQNNFQAFRFVAPSSQTSFLFYEGNTYKGSVERLSDSFIFDFNDYIIFDVGSPSRRTLIRSTGLETAGFLKSDDLSFSTTNTAQIKPVFADKDGKLVVDNAINHYQSYPSSAAQPLYWNDQIQRNGINTYFQTTNAPKTLFVPVNLPDGVKVTNVRMFLLDNSASDLIFSFLKKDNLINAVATLASAKSSTNTSSIFSINDDAQKIINNSQESYFVQVSSVGNWTGSTLQFHSIVITYQYQ